MAYANWGAFVFKDGKRMKNWEDQTPYKETELNSGYHQLWLKEEGDLDTYHAVLGDKNIRLCGYKCYPQLFENGKEIDLNMYGVGEKIDDEYYQFYGIVDDHEFWINNKVTNFVFLKLKQPDGSIWLSKCGFEYGAGHTDDELAVPIDFELYECRKLFGE